MSFEAKIIEDSINRAGIRLITMQLRYPRFVHAEFMTHRVFSRNASSSRAIPVAKMIEQVRTNPAMPVHWGRNQPGMQAREELTGRELAEVKGMWIQAARAAAECAEYMNARGAHKQVVNRILEPFQWISVVVTATEWDNFFELRDHEDADPNIAKLARLMNEAQAASTPTERCRYWQEPVNSKHWHLPYVSEDERFEYLKDPNTLAKLSTARCARVSYLKHDGTKPSIAEDLALYERLVGSHPLHASPTEHAALVGMYDEDAAWNEVGMWHKNFRGWIQWRVFVEQDTMAELDSHA